MAISFFRGLHIGFADPDLARAGDSDKLDALPSEERETGTLYERGQYASSPLRGRMKLDRITLLKPTYPTEMHLRTVPDRWRKSTVRWIRFLGLAMRLNHRGHPARISPNPG